MHECQKCEQKFDYDPKHHRCPGEWEALCELAGAAPLDNKYDGMSWVDECMAKQY